MGASINDEHVASLGAETTSLLDAAARAIGLVDGLFLSAAVLAGARATGVADELRRLHGEFREHTAGALPSRSLRNGPLRSNPAERATRPAASSGRNPGAASGTFLVTQRDVPSPAVDPTALRRIASQWRATAVPLKAAAHALRYESARAPRASWTGHDRPYTVPVARTAEGFERGATLCIDASRAFDTWASDADHALAEAEFLETSIRLFRADVGTSAAPWWLDGDTIFRNAQLALHGAVLRVQLLDSDERCRAALAAIDRDSVQERNPLDELAPRLPRTTLRDVALFGLGGRAHGMDVEPAGLADCWFLSSLAALAESHPQAISDMVRDNGDGTYVVRLWLVDRWRDVAVDPASALAGRARTSACATHTDGASLWPILLSEAAATAVGGCEHLERLHPTVALTMLTGRAPTSCCPRTLPGSGSDAEMSMAWLASRVSTGEIAMVASSRPASPFDHRTGDEPIRDDHSYWVKDMTDAGDGTGSITVVDQSFRSSMTLTWDEYRDAFDGATFVTTS